MTREGWAVAYRRYSLRYVPDEHAARVDKLGLWRGRFMLPWNWRAAKRTRSPARNSWRLLPL
jgi:endonuclease YncB( thermonuclease family)